MFNWRRAKFLTLISLAVILGFFVFNLHPALAQFGQDVAQNIELGDTSPIDIAINVINWALGILSLIAVGIILYGGIVWMSSQGDEEKISKAKSILRNGLIGLVIVLSAWGITTYVLSNISDWTGADDTTTGGETIPGNGDSDSAFYIIQTEPSDEDDDISLCSGISATFSLSVYSATTDDFYLRNNTEGAGGDGEICTDNTECTSGLCEAGQCLGDNVAGEVDYSDIYATFYPDKDYIETTEYSVTLNSDIQGVDDSGIAYDLGCSNGLCVFSFTTGNTTDEVPPYVILTSDGACDTDSGTCLNDDTFSCSSDSDCPASTPTPTDNEEDTCLNTIIRTTFSESIDPVSLASANENIWLYTSTPSAEVTLDKIRTQSLGGQTNDTIYTYSASELTAETDYYLSLYSGDANNDFDGAIADLCRNPLDGDYDGVAEGYIDVDNNDNFIDPSSASTGVNADWAGPWNFKTGVNADCIPEINSFDPGSGYYSDTTVTIYGRYLDQFSDLTFYNDVSAVQDSCFGSDRTVNSLTSCYISGGSDYLRIYTPVGSETGIIKVEGADGSSDSDDSTCTGTYCGEFRVDSPHISRLSPSSGTEGQPVTIKGSNFGDTSGTVYFEGLEAPQPCDNSWTDTQIIVQAPEGLADVYDGDVEVQIYTADGYYSDFRIFDLDTTLEAGPLICAIAPECSNTGLDSAVITGENYGTTQGSVYFYSYDEKISYEASSYITDWQDISTTISQEPSSSQADYNVVILNADEATSNGLDFAIPCADAPQVLERGTCDVDNEIYPSPNPQPKEEEACRNGALEVAFTTASGRTLETSTLNHHNIQLYKCNDGYNDATTIDVTYDTSECSNFDLINLAALSGGGVTLNNSYTTSDDYQGFVVDGLNFSEGYWYKAVVTNDVTDDIGVALSEDYEWAFRVDPADEDCEAEVVSLTPSKRYFNAFDQTTFDDDDKQTSWEDFTSTAYTYDCVSISSDINWYLSDVSDSADDYTVTSSEEIVSFNNDLALNVFESTSGSKNNIYMMGDDESNQGAIYLWASVDEAEDVSSLSVDFGYCEDDSSCNSHCPGSTCDETSHRCKPVINNIEPVQAGPDSCVTISGCYFGVNEGSTGKATFSHPSEGDFDADYPTATGCDYWSDDQVIAQVPSDAVEDGSYNIVLTNDNDLLNNYYKEGDDTFQADFEVDEITRPCLCSIDPSSSRTEGTEVILYGESFGSYSTDSAVNFYNNTIAATIADSADWTDVQISTTVPKDTSTGSVYVYDNNSVQSNPVDFTFTCRSNSDCSTGCCQDGACAEAEVCNECLTKTDCVDEYAGCYADCVDGECTPYISSVSPTSGDAGQPVTISGCYLGSSGSVTFDESINADLLCDESWNNISLIIETPSSSVWGVDGEAEIQVSNSIGYSNDADFVLDNTCSNYKLPVLCETFTNTVGDYYKSSYGTYGNLVKSTGNNFANVDSEYCLCADAGSGEVCQVAADGSTYCTDEAVCTLDSDCSENRDTYDSSTETCSCFDDLSSEVCSVEDGSTECTYSYTCVLDAICDSSNEDYYSVGGFLEYPGSGQISEADYVSGYTNEHMIDSVVPNQDTGITSGNVYTGIIDLAEATQCYSNGSEYSIICSSCSDCGDDQYCDWSYGEGEFGRCTDSASGFCQYDIDYGTDSCCGNTGCVESLSYYDYCTCADGADDICQVNLGEQDCISQSTGDTCDLPDSCSIDNENRDTYYNGTCQSRPSITNTTPDHLNADACLNTSISITFSEAMMPAGEDPTASSYDFSDYIEFYKVGDTTPLSGAIESTNDTTFTFHPDNSLLDGSTTYMLVVYSDDSSETFLVSKDSGLAVSDENEATVIDYSTYGKSFTFDTDATADACPVNLVEIEATDSNFASTYTFISAAETQELEAQAYYDDSSGDDPEKLESIEGVYSWEWSWSPDSTDCGIAGVDTSLDDYGSTNDLQTILAGDTEGSVSVTATATSVDGWIGSVSGSQALHVLFCDSGYIWAYANTDYNFYLAYCREADDGTILPELQGPAIIPGVTGTEDPLYEFLFTLDEDDNEDAVGLRIYSNDIDGDASTYQDAVSPSIWYQKFFESTSSGSKTTVDGYEAVQVGRSTYVSAPNLNATTSSLWPNIYLFSYSQEAQDETAQIVDKLLEYFELSTNIDSGCGEEDSDKNKVIRDTRRLTDLGSIAYYLDNSDSLPDLTSGTYISGLTTSMWGSWQSTLANALGVTLPTDPYNQFYDSSTEEVPCPYDGLNHDPETCWDESAKDFYAPNQDSSGTSRETYFYLYQGDSSAYNLYSHLEYTDGNWDSSTYSDPCSSTGYSDDGCQTFNYTYSSL